MGTGALSLLPLVLLLLLLLMLTVSVEVLPVTEAVIMACLGRGGGVGAGRNCRGHNRGLSAVDGSTAEEPAEEEDPGIGTTRDGPTMPPTASKWLTAGPDGPMDSFVSCTRAPSRGLHGAEFEPKSVASRVIGSRICERRREGEPRISSILHT